MYQAIPARVDELLAAGVRVIVIRGAGDAAFGAGSDISEFGDRRMGDQAAGYLQIEEPAQHALRDAPVPTLALIHGACMGGAAALAVSCDLRYAADDARFAVPPARLGIGYAVSGVRALADAIGAANAKDLLFTARRVDATEALRMGLVNAVLPKAELDSHVGELAAMIADNAPLTVRAVKLSFSDDDEAAEAAVADCMASADYREGIAAFGEKRRPRFTGS